MSLVLRVLGAVALEKNRRMERKSRLITSLMAIEPSEEKEGISLFGSVKGGTG